MAKKESILKSVEKVIEIKIDKNHIPKDFFETGKGLYVWSNFKDNVLSKAEETKSGVEFKIASFELVKTVYDKEIEKDLPKEHIFSETEVCAVVASLIEKQSEGQEGILLNNGYANIFYTTSRVVLVYWYGGGWGVYGWLRVGLWCAGSRVFAPANES